MPQSELSRRLEVTPISGSTIKEDQKLSTKAPEDEQVQNTSPRRLYEQISQDEGEAFARDGPVLAWFSNEKGATPDDSQASQKPSEITENTKVQ
jgi:hypothetical protein